MGYLILDTYDSDEYFVVTEDRVIEPLGLFVLSDNRFSSFPTVIEAARHIPGTDNEVFFRAEFEGRVIELMCATDENLSVADKFALRNKMGQYLNPSAGYKKLIFMDYPDYQYYVRYAGFSDIGEHPKWMMATIPFKAKPYMEKTIQSGQVGEGSISAGGNVATPLTVSIIGPSSHPIINIGASVMTYAADVPAGATLTIDCEKKTVYQGAGNMLKFFSGSFISVTPSLSYPVTFSGGGILTVSWHDRYI